MNYSRNLKDQVAETLALRIVRGDYRPGDVLPKELELKDELDVSRTVLREALGVLSAKGLTDSRTRRGTLVRPRADWNTLDPDVLDWQRTVLPKRQFIAHLMEVRWIVEPAAAALAANRATAQAIERLDALYLKMQGYDVDTKSALNADRMFHQLVLASTENPMLAAMSTPILEALEISIGISNKVTGAFVRACPIHGEILESIRNRDAEGARRSCLRLLEMSAKDLEDGLKE
jgi:GntR family galactonate operon transcriptional repressor